MNAAAPLAETLRTKAVRVSTKAPDLDHLRLAVRDHTLHANPAGDVVVEVVTAGVNPSDVKAVLGAMPHAIWPRTPGRDYAGIVRQGPIELVGKEVWGSGGELGIRRDGTHARYLVVKASDVRLKPSAVSLREAGAIGVPFITAYEGLREAGGVERGNVVLVLGGNGKVGQAAIQLATLAGARVFAVERTREPFVGHATGPVEMIDASITDIATYIHDKTGGHGVDIVYNTVGSPYFTAACRAMGHGARHVLISTIERSVAFDIFAFFRGRHKFIGIDTLALDSSDCARALDALKPGFERGDLKPFPVEIASVYPLDRAEEAYRAVLGGARDRIVLDPAL